MSVSQVRGQSDRCLKSPAGMVTGVGCFRMCRCFLQPAHSLARPQMYISSSDGIGSTSHHLPPGHAIFGLFLQFSGSPRSSYKVSPDWRPP